MTENAAAGSNRRPGMSVADYAAQRRVSRRTVIDWIKAGYVQAIRKGYGPTSPWEIISADPMRSQADPRPIRQQQSRKVSLGQTPTRPTQSQHSDNGEPRYVTDPDIDQQTPRAVLDLSDQDLADYLNRKLADW